MFYRYQVRDGDMVALIARQFGVQSETVLWNNAQAINAGGFAPGTLLEIPSADGILHRVKLGETLTEIADRYGSTVGAIVAFEANGLQNPPQLREDGVLFVPGGRRR